MQAPFKTLLIFSLCVLLTACASGARPDNMISVPIQSNLISKSNKYFQGISIENISGGKETNAMLASKVSNSAFHEALRKSLESHGLLSVSGTPKYRLNAELLALEQPIIGFSFTVDSVAQYKLLSTANNKSVFNETIKASGKATMGDTIVGVERLRIANEYSVKNNIQEFIDKLINN